MKTFKLFFEQTQGETIVLYPGGFKPPTKGHFEVLKDLLQGADKGIVFIGAKVRDGIDQDMSYQIWEIYKKYLDKPIEIEKVPQPVAAVYDYARNNFYDKLLFGIGKKPGDISRADTLRKNPDKYPNLEVKEVEIKGEGISGTKTRERISAKDPNVINYFVPSEVSKEDKIKIKDILNIK